MDRHSFIVFTKAHDGRQDEFNDWYENVHVADILSVPGFVECRRYRLMDNPRGDPRQWDFVAIYEMETDDPQSAMVEMLRRSSSGEMVLSTAMMRDATLTALGSPISRRVSA